MPRQFHYLRGGGFTISSMMISDVNILMGFLPVSRRWLLPSHSSYIGGLCEDYFLFYAIEFYLLAFFVPIFSSHFSLRTHQRLLHSDPIYVTFALRDKIHQRAIPGFNKREIYELFASDLITHCLGSLECDF